MSYFHFDKEFDDTMAGIRYALNLKDDAHVLRYAMGLLKKLERDYMDSDGHVTLIDKSGETRTLNLKK
jgi:hypothetical protein